MRSYQKDVDERLKKNTETPCHLSRRYQYVVKSLDAYMRELHHVSKCVYEEKHGLFVRTGMLSVFKELI
jgi:hypothetical protein